MIKKQGAEDSWSLLTEARGRKQREDWLEDCRSQQPNSRSTQQHLQNNEDLEELTDAL